MTASRLLVAPVVHRTVATPDGTFGLLVRSASEQVPEAVIASGWTDSLALLLGRLAPLDRPDESEVTLAAEGRPERGRRPGDDAVRAVERYYAGELDAILGVAVEQRATPFREDAWAALRRIPAGHPLSYADFAAAAGRPAAVRAAASACATNAVALFVPCHRVLRGSGALGGFAWGLPVKESLLRRERGVG